MTDWKPSESDINWTKNCLSMVKDGGIWATSYALYRKEGETVTLERVNENAHNLKENLERTEKAIRQTGYIYLVDLD